MSSSDKTMDSELVQKLNEKYKKLRNEISKVIVGQNQIIEQIIITKPNIESGPSLGFIPGSVDEKMDPPGMHEAIGKKPVPVVAVLYVVSIELELVEDLGIVESQY